MSKVLELSDEQYKAITQAAATRGQTTDALLAEWIEELRERAQPPRYYDTDDWFRHLGMSDAVIAQVKEEVRREVESDADA